jgi:tripartite-type tricarboxylate transporter receptor subunit TctC
VTALFRKDVDAFASGFTSPLLPYCDSEELRVIFLFLKEPWELMPQTPTLQGTPYEELEIFNNDRVIAGPPDMKEEVIHILRKAMDEALQDPDLLAWSQKTKNPLMIMNAGETKKRIAEIRVFVDKYRDLLKK